MINNFFLFLLFIALIGVHGNIKAQDKKQVYKRICADSCIKADHAFNYKQIIAPAALIGVGAIGVSTSWGRSIDKDIRDQVIINDYKKTRIDDYMQYSPMVAVYGLDLFGVKGRHNFRDKTIILATSYLIMGVTTNSIKAIVGRQRPDGSANNSFSSGHAATAFMGAEFLRQEYKHLSPWYGIAGYAVATATGVLRIHNNRHWLSDVIAGAGVGILSTKIAYWVYPSMRRSFFKNCKKSVTLASPYYNGESTGIAFYAVF